MMKFNDFHNTEQCEEKEETPKNTNSENIKQEIYVNLNISVNTNEDAFLQRKSEEDFDKGNNSKRMKFDNNIHININQDSNIVNFIPDSNHDLERRSDTSKGYSFKGKRTLPENMLNHSNSFSFNSHRDEELNDKQHFIKLSKKLNAQFSKSPDSYPNNPILIEKNLNDHSNNSSFIAQGVKKSSRNSIFQNIHNRKITYGEPSGLISIKGFNNFECHFEDKNRKYNRINIENAKNFFKYRYISDKIRFMMSSNGDSRKSSTTNLINLSKITDNNINVVSNRASFSINHAPDDKYIIKFNAIFLQKLEKSIFLFNLKKFEASYNYLIESGIIKDFEEFGELILITKGFDKTIIGEFLAKEKFPNKDYKILSSFMQKIDFNCTKYTDALRFFLSRLNLPKDSSLILKIIEVFSDFYIKANPNAGFKDSTSIYLLTSTVLALNTTFIRTDIENMRGITKEDFIKWNSTAERHVVESIYDDIKMNKLDIVYDYNELIYRRLSVGVGDTLDNFIINTISKDNSLKKENNLAVVQEAADQCNCDSQGENICENLSEIECEDLLRELKRGENFTKYGKYGNPHSRFVRLSEDEAKISWTQISMCSKFLSKPKFIEVNLIKDVYIGISNSEIFEKYKIPNEFDRFCFSIETIKRSLDLRKDDEKICRKWFQGIKYLIAKTNKKKLKKTKKDVESCGSLVNEYNPNQELHEIISSIWKNEILPNWKMFRTYIQLGEKFHNSNQMHKKVKKTFSEKFKNMKKVDKMVDEKEKYDFIYFYTHFGIPNWMRKKVWQILIGNQMNISEILFDKFCKKIERVHFVWNTDSNSYSGMIFLDNPSKTFHQSDPQREQKEQTANLNEFVIKQILADIDKIYLKFKHYIKNQNIEEAIFKEEMYKILRVFTLERPDINYSKHLAYFACIFLLNSDNYFTAYVMLINFLCSKCDFLLKFLIRDEIFIKTKFDLFEKYFTTHIPKVWKHFKNLDISSSLFFYNWFEYAFIKYFLTGREGHDFLLKLFDSLLVRGEIFMMECALSLIKLQEKYFISVRNILKIIFIA